MTLAQKVQALRAGSPGVPAMSAARQILAAILAPTKVEGTAQVSRPGAAAERALRALVVPAVMTSQQWNTRASAGTLEDTISNVLAGRVRDALAALSAAQDVAAKVTAMTAVVDALGLAYQIDNQERVVRRKGGEPYAVAAGTDTRAEPSYSEGPSWWDSTFPGQPAPTLAQIRAEMT